MALNCGQRRPLCDSCNRPFWRAVSRVKLAGCQRLAPLPTRQRSSNRCMVLLAAVQNAKPDSTMGGTNYLNVADTVIKPVYRSTPWAAEQQEQELGRSKARILFIGESNTCRSVLAEAMFRKMISSAGLDDLIECDSKGSRDYQVGESYPPVVAQVAAEMGLELPSTFAARLFNAEQDIVSYDLVLVMDKFTCADVMRDVAGYDLINKATNYSAKVRQLGEFHPVMSQSSEPEGQDVGDPLYGNNGGPQEKEAVSAAAVLLQDACLGLLQFVRELAAGPGAESGLRVPLRSSLTSMQRISWLVPPMLQGRVAMPKTDDGFV